MLLICKQHIFCHSEQKLCQGGGVLGIDMSLSIDTFVDDISPTAIIFHGEADMASVRKLRS